MAGRHDRTNVPLFSLRRIFAISWVTATAVVFFNVFLKFANRQVLENPPSIPVYWPVSIFVFRLGRLRLGWAIPMGVVAIVVFVATAVYLRDEETLAPVVVAGLALLVCSNLLHGFTHGFVVPLATRESYYQLAATITDPVAFVRTYGGNQLSYVVHAKTHPPGAVLTFTLLDWVFGSRAAIAAAIAALSLPLSATLLYRLLRTYYERRIAGYTTLLFVLVPAVQIFYLATLDAIVATLVLATVYLFTRKSRLTTLGTFACLLVTSFLAFQFAFVLPVLAAICLFRRKKIPAFVGIVLGLVVVYVLVDIGLGYNYLDSFLAASNQQNPGGFMLTAEPANYVFTRFEDVAELLLFFTPFLTLLAARGLRALWEDLRGEQWWILKPTAEREPFVIALAALCSFAAMLAVGVYHTGETARGALYLYPFLLLPVAAVIRRTKPRWRDKWLLAGAVFGQTLFLQLLGSYLW